MRNFVITDNMAKGFATEIENNIEKINSKGGMPFLTYVLHLKGGKTEQISENTTRMCATLSLLMPFKIEGITDRKRRGHVIFENGECSVGSARNILGVVVDAIEEFEYYLDEYKNDSMLCFKSAFKEVVEQYGFEDLEKRIADFFEYLTNLGGSENVEVEEQTEEVEENDAPNLNKDVIIDYLMNLGSTPYWVYKDVFDFEVKGDYLDIVMFGDYHIGLYFDPNDSIHDFAKVYGSSAYGKEDMKYALEIMENRDEILALAGFKYKYNVIAHCSDGDVIIGKDGVNDVTIDVAKEIALAHMNMGAEISIEKVVKL